MCRCGGDGERALRVRRVSALRQALGRGRSSELPPRDCRRHDGSRDGVLESVKVCVRFRGVPRLISARRIRLPRDIYSTGRRVATELDTTFALSFPPLFEKSDSWFCFLSVPLSRTLYADLVCPGKTGALLGARVHGRSVGASSRRRFVTKEREETLCCWTLSGTFGTRDSVFSLTSGARRRRFSLLFFFREPQRFDGDLSLSKEACKKSAWVFSLVRRFTSRRWGFPACSRASRVSVRDASDRSNFRARVPLAFSNTVDRPHPTPFSRPL